MPRRLALLLALVACASLPACGGGGESAPADDGTPDPDPDPNPTLLQTIDIPFDPANAGLTTGAGQMAINVTLAVGDLPTNVDQRGHLRFALGAIPANATLTVAVLRCSQVATSNLPYATLGTVNVDHVDQGPGLDPTDHISPALTPNVGALSVDATPGVKTLQVTAQVEADRAAFKGTSDFRLSFTVPTDADAQPDTAFFRQLQPGEELVLRVTFTTP